MTFPKYETKHGTVYVGDCIEVMKTLPEESVHMVCTSPPYFNQRDYGVSGQIGLEKTPQQYVKKLVDVFKEVHRVLRDDGCVFLNIGDSYGDKKQLVGIPWKTAFALQEDGWILRQDIIWNAPNKMPESVTDRCSRSHEYFFMLSKHPKYFFDSVAIRERSISGWKSEDFIPNSKKDKQDNTLLKTSATAASRTNRSAEIQESRNKRSVWIVPVGREKEKHFACYPPKLIIPCILAGTSQKGVCNKCGVPWKRKLEKKRKETRPGTDTKITGNAWVDGNRDPKRHITEVKTIGWEPGCECTGNAPIPATVLDPFSGLATTGRVSIKRGRRYIGIELNKESAEISIRKLRRAEAERGFGFGF